MVREMASGSGPELPMQLWTAKEPATKEWVSLTARSNTARVPAGRRSITPRAIVGSARASLSGVSANQGSAPMSPSTTEGAFFAVLSMRQRTAAVLRRIDAAAL